MGMCLNLTSRVYCSYLPENNFRKPKLPSLCRNVTSLFKVTRQKISNRVTGINFCHQKSPSVNFIVFIIFLGFGKHKFEVKFFMLIYFVFFLTILVFKLVTVQILYSSSRDSTSSKRRLRCHAINC